MVVVCLRAQEHILTITATTLRPAIIITKNVEQNSIEPATKFFGNHRETRDAAVYPTPSLKHTVVGTCRQWQWRSLGTNAHLYRSQSRLCKIYLQLATMPFIPTRTIALSCLPQSALVASSHSLFSPTIPGIACPLSVQHTSVRCVDITCQLDTAITEGHTAISKPSASHVMFNYMYLRFLRHAMPHLRSSRYAWTTRDRKRTIETIFYINETVREHYGHTHTEIPSLNTLFPNEPCTEADLVEARSHGLTPERLAQLYIPRTMPIAETITCDRGTQTTPPATPAATEQPATPIQEGPPYKHWPAYPWPYEPQLPDIAPPSGTIGISLQTLDTFLRTKPHMSDEETHWHGAKFLGNGSYGAVGLWCEVDEHGNVIDRMVVKDNHAVNRAAWRDPKYWRDNLPREIAINRRIESRRTAEPEACQNIVKYRGHRLLMGQCRYRLYTDFASGGNIAEAMMPYHERWDGIEMSRVPTERFLPEAFIWHTIKALATACLLLETGTLGDTPVDDWKPIFHLDFQTPNILLDVQSKKRKAPAEEEPEAIPPSAGPIKRLKGREAAAKVVIDARSSSTTANTSQDLKIIVPKLADFGLSFYDLDFSECPAMDENPRDYTLTSTDNRYAPVRTHFLIPLNCNNTH